MEYKMVIAVRKDLGISPGKTAVQVAHAAVDCSMKAKKKATKWFRQWYEEGQRKVAVKVESLEDLQDLEALARREGLITSMIRDAGLTQIPPGTVTCLGIGPVAAAALPPSGPAPGPSRLGAACSAPNASALPSIRDGAGFHGPVGGGDRVSPPVRGT